MTQATQVLSKAAENMGKSLEKALYVKSSVQKATDDLNTLTSQISTAGDAGAILSNRLKYSDLNRWSVSYRQYVWIINRGVFGKQKR